MKAEIATACDFDGTHEQCLAERLAVYVYRLNGPIESWAGWHSLKDAICFLIKEDECVRDDSIDWEADEYSFLVSNVLYLFEMGMIKAFCELGWEGDISEGPYVTAVPTLRGGSDYIVAWKQENKGATFIVSRCPLDSALNGSLVNGCEVGFERVELL